MCIRHHRLVPLLLGAVVACGGGGSALDPADPDDDVVVIRLTAGLRFVPEQVTIEPGTTVRWVNEAPIFHTITPDDPGQAGVWARTATTSTGTALTHTFAESGEFTYHCEPHLPDGMVGVIRVQ